MSTAIAFAFWLIVGPAIALGILYAVGDTIDTITDEQCPPYYQCTPSGDWNHPNCKCWERK